MTRKPFSSDSAQETPALVLEAVIQLDELLEASAKEGAARVMAMTDDEVEELISREIRPQ